MPRPRMPLVVGIDVGLLQRVKSVEDNAGAGGSWSKAHMSMDLADDEVSYPLPPLPLF